MLVLGCLVALDVGCDDRYLGLGMLIGLLRPFLTLLLSTFFT